MNFDPAKADGSQYEAARSGDTPGDDAPRPASRIADTLSTRRDVRDADASIGFAGDNTPVNASETGLDGKPADPEDTPPTVYDAAQQSRRADARRKRKRDRQKASGERKRATDDPASTRREPRQQKLEDEQGNVKGDPDPNFSVPEDAVGNLNDLFGIIRNIGGML